MPSDRRDEVRRRGACWDAEQTARLYRKLVRMLAAGEKIYAHLPAGAPPAAASGDSPPYPAHRKPRDRPGAVQRTGAVSEEGRTRG